MVRNLRIGTPDTISEELFETGEPKITELRPGDYGLAPAHRRHHVSLEALY